MMQKNLVSLIFGALALALWFSDNGGQITLSY